MGGVEALAAYKEMGVAALFILLYVTTVWFLIRVLLQDKKELRAAAEREVLRSESMARIIQENTTSNNHMVSCLKELRGTLDTETETNRDLITYLRAKDSFRSRGNG